ncbi:MAG: carboxy terminal-processing peptidase [Spirochaetota bacterium]|nr:carboxy terminal-processing peptidase [Spirochaetota bacterium]
MANNRQKRTISFIVAIILVLSCLKKTEGLKKSDIKPIISIFLARHVKYHEFNDEISSRTLINLMKYLDPGKYYFFQGDVDIFFHNKDKIDDLVNSDQYDFIFEILKVYKKRVSEGIKRFHLLIENKYDFNKDESIIIDRDKAQYSTDEKDMQERWRKNIKLQLFNQMAIVKDIVKAKKKLKKKYRLYEKRINEIDSAKITSIFVNCFSTALDPHSNYLTREEHEDFMISTKLKLEGIGVLLRSEDGFVIVESIIPAGAAAKLSDDLKLKPNDKIVAVAEGDNGEPVDVIDMALRDVVKLIRGKKGTKVRLTILREVGETHEQLRNVIPIIREEIKLEDRAAKSQVYTTDGMKNQLRIGYIKLSSFYLDFDAIQKNDPNAKSSSKDIIIQINKLKNKGIDGIVLDLRGNPGGALTESINIAGMFIDQGPIVQILDGRDSLNVMKDNDPGVYYDGPMVVLIDRFSASASEIFAGAIKDYGRGLIIGPCSTFGKGSVQTYNVLPSRKGAMKITTALFYQPAGSSNQLNGIHPDITIPDISSIWEIGENELHNAIKWEKIKRANYVPYQNYINEKIISQLVGLSSARIKSNKKFTELINKINKFKEKLKRKEFSLKEEAGIEDQKRKDVEKKLRTNKNDMIIDLENDLFLHEAFNIAVDYIKRLN